MSSEEGSLELDHEFFGSTFSMSESLNLDAARLPVSKTITHRPSSVGDTYRRIVSLRIFFTLKKNSLSLACRHDNAVVMQFLSTPKKPKEMLTWRKNIRLNHEHPPLFLFPKTEDLQVFFLHTKLHGIPLRPHLSNFDLISAPKFYSRQVNTLSSSRWRSQRSPAIDQQWRW